MKESASIFAAVETRSIDAVASIIRDSPEQVRAQNEQGYQPLHFAAERNDVAISEFLIKNGADINACGKDGRTPLRVAIERESDDVAKLLIDLGASSSIPDNEGKTARQRYDDRIYGDKEPIFIAIDKGDMQAVVELLKADPSLLHARAKCGDEPLHRAAQEHHVNLIHLLLDLGADVNCRGDRGYTPLHYCRHVHAAEVLIARGADVNAKDNFGRTPLQCISGAVMDEWGIVGLLLGSGAEIDLYTAIWMKRTDWARWILHEQPDVVRNAYSRRLLTHAIVWKNKDILELLLAHGADPNEWLGEPPLTAAVSSAANDLAIARLLIEKGADVNAKADAGDTALKRAKAVGFQEAVDLLLAFGAKD